MANKILILILLFSILSCNYSSKKIVVDNVKNKGKTLNFGIGLDCEEFNWASLSYAMLEALGEERVEELFFYDFRFLVLIETDSIGQTTHAQIRNKDQLLTDQDKDLLINYLVRNKTVFKICYQMPPFNETKTKDEIADYFINGFYEERRDIITTASFPNTSRVWFKIEWEDYLKNNKDASFISFLKMKIEEFLSKEIEVYTPE